MKNDEEKIKLNIPVIVEGIYDKNCLQSVIEASIITTDGFGIFNNIEKESLIKKLSFRGIVVLCDSDGAGRVIRSGISSIVPRNQIYPLYIPQITGKEKRKAAPSKEGFLGVEGIDKSILGELFRKFAESHPEFVCEKAETRKDEIKITDLYEHGLTGHKGSQSARDIFCRKTGLPSGMNGKALCCALNMLYTKKEFFDLI